MDHKITFNHSKQERIYECPVCKYQENFCRDSVDSRDLETLTGLEAVHAFFFVRNLLEEISALRLPNPGGYLTREVTGVCGKSLHTLYPVA